jgi:hypothetical protein
VLWNRWDDAVIGVSHHSTRYYECPTYFAYEDRLDGAPGIGDMVCYMMCSTRQQ